MKKLMSLALAALLALSLAACGAQSSSEAAAPASAAADPAAAAPQPEAEPAQEPAGLSGRVVVYMPSPAGMADEIAAAFEAKTGVVVEQFQGTTGEILARLEAESANPVADVVVLASWSDGLALKNGGGLLAYTPENADKLYPGWKDGDGMLYGTSASAVGVIYNTTVFESLDADWDELAGPQYANQLAIPDPEKSGSAKDFLSGYIYALGEADGWATWEALAQNGMTVPGANKAALESVTTGEVGILVAGVDYNAYSSMAKGEPLDIYYPAGGTVINPRPAMILETAPNMDNAKAFMDFLLGDEAQQLVADAYLLPGRSDIQCQNRANVADIPVVDTDWAWMMDNAGDIAARLLALCA